MSEQGNSSDQSLLEDIANENQAAMESFYKRHASAVYGFAMKTLQNPVDASEVVNEVMLEVWKKAASFEGKSAVKTWLLSITHHKSVDLIRRSQRHHHESDEHIDEKLNENPACSVLDGQLSAENAGHIKTCMNELQNGHRQVVYLTFFEGFSYPEIARTLEIPDGTVKTRMMHAKKALFACLNRFLNAV